MDYDKYIFVDYENVQDINIDIIDKNAKMLIIVGETQKKIPINLIQMTQPYGDSIEWLQIKSNGKKNALDFFIVYFLGYYISTDNNKEYIIYSKDTGYDPLIEYLKGKNINVKRIVSFKQININNLGNELNTFNEDHKDNILKLRENLNKVAANKRPKSKKSLVGHIKTLLKKSDDEIEKIIEEMFIQKIIYEGNGQIKYNLK
ncbi:hypothetical protein AGMMS49546_31670 [Spirochaetia bacterium]|nr:hypothetical protein AGMMS49546_31670 [Spirochaetia bacterium]